MSISHDVERRCRDGPREAIFNADPDADSISPEIDATPFPATNPVPRH